jgi:hypothetical protein
VYDEFVKAYFCSVNIFVVKTHLNYTKFEVLVFWNYFISTKLNLTLLWPVFIPTKSNVEFAKSNPKWLLKMTFYLQGWRII